MNLAKKLEYVINFIHLWGNRRMIQFHSIRPRKEYHHICNDELSYNLHKITGTFVLLEFLISSAVLTSTMALWEF